MQNKDQTPSVPPHMAEAGMSEQRISGRRAALKKRLQDLEWQIAFAKNQIFYCEEKRSRHTEQLQAFRDRARAELAALDSED